MASLQNSSKISPNKTIVGCVGGVIGGIAGAILTYFIYYGLSALSIETVDEVTKLVSTFKVDGLMLVWFVLIGFIASVAGQAGDLFEKLYKAQKRH